MLYYTQTPLPSVALKIDKGLFSASGDHHPVKS